MRLQPIAIAICILSATACQQQGFDTTIVDNSPEEHSSSSDVVLTVTDANFQTEVLESSLPVLIDFWAPWCGPCRTQGPIVDAIAEEMREEVKIVKVNIDESTALAKSYGVAAIPTLIFFKNGEPVERFEGLQNRQTLIDVFAKLKNESSE